MSLFSLSCLVFLVHLNLLVLALLTFHPVVCVCAMQLVSNKEYEMLVVAFNYTLDLTGSNCDRCIREPHTVTEDLSKGGWPPDSDWNPEHCFRNDLTLIFVSVFYFSYFACCRVWKMAAKFVFALVFVVLSTFHLIYARRLSLWTFFSSFFCRIFFYEGNQRRGTVVWSKSWPYNWSISLWSVLFGFSAFENECCC